MERNEAWLRAFCAAASCVNVSKESAISWADKCVSEMCARDYFTPAAEIKSPQVEMSHSLLQTALTLERIASRLVEFQEKLIVPKEEKTGE